jgi:hypothetical protein
MTPAERLEELLAEHPEGIPYHLAQIATGLTGRAFYEEMTARGYVAHWHWDDADELHRQRWLKSAKKPAARPRGASR